MRIHSAEGLTRALTGAFRLSGLRVGFPALLAGGLLCGILYLQPLGIAVASPASTTPSPPKSNLTESMRARFRESRNYAELVHSLVGAAGTGDPVAQYLVARALKYCNDVAHIHRSFRSPDGSLRARNEVEVRIGKYPVALQQEILDAYDRCEHFAADSSQADETSAWTSWLDKAVAAGYPPAQSFQAGVSRLADVMRDAAKASPGDIIPTPHGPARDLALAAALSGNPDSIFAMMEWVDGSKRGLANYSELAGAWGLLACERGYDECGPTSQWLRSICSYDVQCADDTSVIDALRRQFGNRFDDVQKLATEIGLAVDQKDGEAVEGYL